MALHGDRLLDPAPGGSADPPDDSAPAVPSVATVSI